ncbi:MAG: thioredoxin family protein [Acidobacteriota bacterium]
MRSKAVFYHAGCAICVDAERNILSALDSTKYDIEVVHLGEVKDRIKEAESKGVKSVPALILNNQIYHINFGASLSDLKG